MEPQDQWLVLLPLLIVLSTFLFLLLIFLLCVLLIRRRRGISLRDPDGPTDMSREDLIEADGGFEGLESRWLESVQEPVRRAYLRARDYQLQYPPNSLSTDITLAQFLSIQEKGVSAWCFEPDYETVNSLLVHARTEITFLPDPASSSCVQSNLPLPKLNEVYYWEVKMFDLPESTNVAVGLATKPYPTFRLPGLSRHSVAYHSNGDKSYNYPFTATTYGAPLKEADVLGVGYRPRSGTVFFTRNGRKMEDAFIGLNRWNLFPTVGADGPCSVHVNLGQAGFVFVEANVKKWGLAPSVGTLAPPPAYGSERGSILLDVGGRIRSSGDSTPSSSPGGSSPVPSRRSTHGHRSRRARHPAQPGEPVVSSPLRTAEPITPPPPVTPIDEETPGDLPGPSSFAERYISPTDIPFHAPPNTNLPPSPGNSTAPIEADEDRSQAVSPVVRSRSSSPNTHSGARNLNPFVAPRRLRGSLTHMAISLSDPGSTNDTSTRSSNSEELSTRAPLQVNIQPTPDSPLSPNNPPTPNHRDIHLQSLPPRDHRRTNSAASQNSIGEIDLDDTTTNAESQVLSFEGSLSRRDREHDPPAYSPLDAVTYAEGVHIDLPAEVIAAALEGNSIPPSAVGQSNTASSRAERRRQSRR